MAGYQRAVLLSPDDSFSWRSLASFSILYNQDVSGAGIQAARKAVALDPGLAANLDIMAQVLIKTGDFSTAERFLQRALEEEPDNALVHLHYGILLLQKGSSPTARAYLETAAALDGDGPIARQANRLLEAYGKGP
jgi:Flp pilus assembly protein TadD